jgi:hypothetical protein
MIRIYRYVLMHDTGMAPNPRGGLVTLGTCKPEIRKRAREGDWVVANFPSPRNELVAWAGKIKRCIPVGHYAWEFPERHDALHEMRTDGEPQRIRGKHEWYHRGANEQRKDRTGNVLVFDMSDCWYFGNQGRQFPPALEHLIARGQGHRVNNRKQGDLAQLQAWLKTLGSPGIHGTPRDGWEGPGGGGCGRVAQKSKLPTAGFAVPLEGRQ